MKLDWNGIYMEKTFIIYIIHQKKIDALLDASMMHESHEKLCTKSQSI